MTTKQLLIKAKAKIADPKDWLIGAYCADSNNVRTSLKDPLACKFCAVGAVMHQDSVYGSEALHILNMQARRIGYDKGASDLNDMSRSHSLVMTMYDLAIEVAPE